VRSRGRCPPALKTLYLVFAGGLLFVGVFLIVNTGPMMGVYAPSGYPGAPFAWLICCLFGGIFLSLALEDNFPKINTYLMKAWLKPTMACLGIKSINEFGHAYRGIESINSDVALCFWLVDGYRSNFFVYKRVLLALALVILPVSMAYFELPDSWAGEYANYNRGIGFLPSTFISSQSTTIYLMISQVLFTALKPPPVKVDYSVAQTTREHHANPTFFTELASVLSASKTVVEKEACHFVGDFKVDGGAPVPKTPEERMNGVKSTTTPTPSNTGTMSV